MAPSKLISKLRTELKTKTLTEVANKMGYSSPSTIHAWVANGAIPKKAVPAVRKYFGVH
jgi:hypothetical protein